MDVACVTVPCTGSAFGGRVSRDMRFLLVLVAALAGAQTVDDRLNGLVAMWEQGRAPLGIFASNISTRGGASVAGSPVDFVIIDMEHSPYDPSRLEAYLLGMIDKRRIVETKSLKPAVVPLVRLPANGREHVEYMIKQVLDLGAFGVVVPHVNNREDALAAVRAMRYAEREGARDAEPRGRRGVGYGWAARYWGIPAARYVERADLWPLDPRGELLLWCMVESGEGVEHAREIASTPGVSGIFLGPSDLAVSLGIAESDPRLEQATEKVLAACRETGTPCGTLTSGEKVAKRLKQGFRFLAVGSDSGLPASTERSLRIGRETK